MSIIKAIRNINARRNAKSVMTFDFSTLYTKIPHNKLKDALHELTDFCFKGCPNSKISVDKNGAFWSDPNEKSSNGLSFSKNDVKKAFSYLLDNCFFCIGDSVFQQRIGIPMGTDPAPFMANLFLYTHERKFLLNLKKTDLRRARRFGNVFRFIDDLCAINDGGEFEKCYHDIYPPELELKKENDASHSASFLDLDLSISDRLFDLKLYDKRDAFPFSIVCMPYISNNMPSRIFYSTLGGELLRIAQCTTRETVFRTTCCKLIDRIYSQGGEHNRIRKSINKIYTKHRDTFSYFYNTPSAFVHAILFGTT